MRVAPAKVFQWLGLSLLLCIGLGGAVTLIQFSRAAAADETFCFSSAYTAARLAVEREANGSLQDFGWFEAQTRRYGFKATDIFAGNPPSAALIMTPIAGLEHEQARVVWIWLSLLFWAAGVAILGFELVRRSGGSAVAAAPMLLCLATLFAPLKSNLEVGHVYAFAFLLQSIGCWLWLRQRPMAAGAVLGSLLALKGYGAPLVLLGVLRRDWRFAGAAGAALAGLAGLAGLLLGFTQWIYFAETYLGGSLFGTRTPALQTLKSFLSYALRLPTVQSGRLRVLTPSADHMLAAILTILVAALLVWLSEFRLSNFLSRGRAVEPPSRAVLSACVLMNLIFSPWAEDHAYPMAMTAVLLMIPELRRMRMATAGVIAGGLLLSWPFHLGDRMLVRPWNLFTDFSRLWGALILLAAALLSEYQRRRGHDAETARGWPGAALAGAVGIVLTLWYVKPWRDPVEHGPLLAVSQSEAKTVTLVRLDIEERAVATIPLSCTPSVLAFGEPRDRLYAGCRDGGEIRLIDLRRRRERETPDTHDVPGKIRYLLEGRSRQEVATNGAGDRVLVANFASDTLSVLDSKTGRELAQIPVCSGPVDVATVRRRGGDLAYVACSTAGSVDVIDINRLTEIQRIAVGKEPGAIAVHPDGRRVYICVNESDRLVVLETGRPSRILRRMRLDGGPSQIAIAP